MKLRARALLVLLVLALVPVAVLVAQRCASGTVATERIFAAIGVREGITVCEMGAGNGELSIAAAKIAGPNGRIYTSELGEDRVKTLRERTAASGLSQITVVAGDPTKTNFPEGACDALFMRNVYHHFADPTAMNASILASVKPGAKVAVVDFAPPNDEAPTPADRSKDGMHGIKAQTLAKELQAAGFEAVSTEAGDQRWFMVVVTRPSR
jgi:ubiquinone/menaquinone biosynthesis C-methylase UbiE